MFYKYNEKKLKFERCDKLVVKFVTGVILIILVTSLSSYSLGRFTAIDRFIELESPLYIIEKDNPNHDFSRDALVDMIKELGIKYPEIVLAQSILETGHWTSTIFEENHNLFGMKQARSRIRTAKGTQLNHAYYDNWKESVYDYAFYQSRYLSKINSEKEYFAALDATYAEATDYSETLKSIIEKEDLKKLFE